MNVRNPDIVIYPYAYPRTAILKIAIFRIVCAFQMLYTNMSSDYI